MGVVGVCVLGTGPFLLARRDPGELVSTAERSEADWVDQPIPAMYLANHVRLALGLEGTPDPSLAVIQAAVTKTGYGGYVAMEYVAPAPAAAKGGTGGGTGGAGGVKAARR